jgi:hypothetical protein
MLLQVIHRLEPPVLCSSPDSLVQHKNYMRGQFVRINNRDLQHYFKQRVMVGFHFRRTRHPPRMLKKGNVQK